MTLFNIRLRVILAYFVCPLIIPTVSLILDGLQMDFISFISMFAFIYLHAFLICFVLGIGIHMSLKKYNKEGIIAYALSGMIVGFCLDSPLLGFFVASTFFLIKGKDK
jgi:hypothetical protein